MLHLHPAKQLAALAVESDQTAVVHSCGMSAAVPLQFTDPKLGSDLKFDVMDFKGPTQEPEDNIMSSMLDSAKIFSEIWETGVHLPCHVYHLNQLLCHACIAAV